MRALVWKDGDTVFGVDAWETSDATREPVRCALAFLAREYNIVEGAAMCTSCGGSCGGSAVDTFVGKASDTGLGGLAWKRAYAASTFKWLLPVGLLRWE